MKLPTAQSRYLAPTLAALTAAGAPVGKLLVGAGLEKFRLSDSDAVIPVARMLALFELIALRESDAALPVEIARAYRLGAVPGWGGALLACPDILSTIHLATDPRARIMSHNVVTAQIDGPKAIFSTHYTTENSPGQEWIAIMSCLLTLDGFRAGCGPDWLPDEIDIAASNIDVLADLVDLSGVVVRTG